MTVSTRENVIFAPTARDEWVGFDARLRRYVARRLGAAAEVDDVVQEILARVHAGLPGLRDDNRFDGWVYRIASRVVVDSIRSRRRDPLRHAAGFREPVCERADEDSTLEAELVQCVAQFVTRLAPRYREAITLTELDGLTQKDAARLLGISLTAMKARVLRGRGKIRDMFDACCRISTDCRGRVVDCESRPLEDVPEDFRAAAAEWIARRGRR
jgi:RNA polymerase sigma-70 factor, ECF subfamily